MQIEMNGGILRGRPRPGRGCSAIDGWMDGCIVCSRLFLWDTEWTVRGSGPGMGEGLSSPVPSKPAVVPTQSTI